MSKRAHGGVCFSPTASYCSNATSRKPLERYIETAASAGTALHAGCTCTPVRRPCKRMKIGIICHRAWAPIRPPPVGLLPAAAPPLTNRARVFESISAAPESRWRREPLPAAVARGACRGRWRQGSIDRRKPRNIPASSSLTKLLTLAASHRVPCPRQAVRSVWIVHRTGTEHAKRLPGRQDYALWAVRARTNAA